MKFVGVGLDDDDRSPRRKLPCSPIPSRKIPRAPLADLLADFEGPSDNGSSTDDKIMNDALLDQQNANTALRCSRQNCKLNSPAQNASIIQDPLIAPYYIPLCICGAPMTRIPVRPPSNDNDTTLVDTSNTNDLTEQTVALTEDKATKSEDTLKCSWPIPVSRSSSEKLNGNKGNRQRRVEENNLNEEDQLLSTGSTPTEETKLIEKSPIARVSEKMSK